MYIKNYPFHLENKIKRQTNIELEIIEDRGKKCQHNL
jgi:hypothetical protein